MRVYELAKELGVTSKELLVRLKSLGIPAGAHTSALKDVDVDRLRTSKSPTVSPSAGRTPARAQKPQTKLVAGKPRAPERVSTATLATARPKSVASVKVKAPLTLEKPQKPHPRAVTRIKTSSTTSTAVSPRPTPPAAPASPAQTPTLVSSVSPVAPLAQPQVEAPQAPPATRRLVLRSPITVKELAMKLEVKPTDVIKYLMQQGVLASIIQPLDEVTVTKVAQAFHCEVLPEPTLEEQIWQTAQPDPAQMVSRAPVVTLMGHVDHGKTSLLDAIRKAKVAEQEAGGITQHIGAYEVTLDKGRVIFLDTPGHEAFSALRARGAHVTDIVVLVVAADDGVMPQTVEAIDHAKAANAPIVVAINKIDKPEANPQRIQQQLSQYGLLSEDWGGKTVMVPVSAKTGEGIKQLLEMLLLEAELLELKADPTTTAHGTVIEAKQTATRGTVATLLVQHGTLRIGDLVVVGHLAGRVRAMINDRGHRLKDVGPATPAEVLGLPEVPTAGDQFLVMEDERLARQLVEQRQTQRAQHALVHPKRVTLDDLHQRITEGKLKELRLVLKADVQGSLEAITQSLRKLDTVKQEVQVKVLHTAIGDITESDIVLAAASDAVILGFHVGMDVKVQVLAANEGVDVRIYQIIYELADAIQAAIEGLLEPRLEETFMGRAEVRKLFQVSKVGMVAGCLVTTGTIRRDCLLRVIRGRERLFEGKIANLKRVKDEVRDVQQGLECGISIEGNTDLQVGDLLEAWDVKKIARKLSS